MTGWCRIAYIGAIPLDPIPSGQDMTIHQNFHRRRVDFRRRCRQGHQPVRPRRHGRRIRPRLREGCRGRHRGRQGRRPGMGALDPAGPLRRPDEDRHRDSRPQGRTRPAPVAGGGQALGRRHRRGHPRRADLHLLRRRGGAASGREAGLDPARHRRGDHARADGRRRHDHARGTFPWRFPPGRSLPRSPTATRW